MTDAMSAIRAAGDAMPRAARATRARASISTGRTSTAGAIAVPGTAVRPGRSVIVSTKSSL